MTPETPARTEGFPSAIYAITVFISAFLLFQVQPLLSKFILPWFGGTPAVWTAAMLFFQIVLFLGYLYAHLTSVYLTPRGRLYCHFVVLLVALVSVTWNRLVPPASLRPLGVDHEQPLLQVLLLLGATVGLPYFALSSTGPLLQKWFSETFGKSPYRLFALSNFGSLLALLSYPFFFEANYGIVTQAAMWSLGFVFFAVCCGCCAWHNYVFRRHGSMGVCDSSKPDASSVVDGAKSAVESNEVFGSEPTWIHRLGWLALPTLACVLFLAVTNEVCQNIATVPLLWIVPLALYLLSFIVAFDQPKWYSRPAYAMVSLCLLFCLVNFSMFAIQASRILNSILGLRGDGAVALSKLWWVEAGLYFMTMFSLLVICHGELAKSKPSTKHLTSFYLTLSLGGALGGLLVNLLATYLFTSFFELTLAFLFSAVLCAGLLSDLIFKQGGILRKAVVACGTILAIAICCVLAIHELPKKATDRYSIVHESRNFYGVLSVIRTDRATPEDMFTFVSGHIRHGMQYADPSKRHIPLSYYGEGSGCETAIRVAQGKHQACRIGVIGLGVGTIAAYARPQDTVRFYEINPRVIEIAQNTQWFHYLAECRGKVETVLGDARLRLEKELKGGECQPFDVLVLDAFSGDAIPTHLLTDQAFGLYTEHLKSDGILVVHITNTHLDLYPVVKQLADKHGYSYRRIFRAKTESLNPNYYMLLSRDPGSLEQVTDDLSSLPEFLAKPRTVPLWTDEYTNLTRLLR